MQICIFKIENLMHIITRCFFANPQSHSVNTYSVLSYIVLVAAIIKMNSSESRPRKVELTCAQLKNATTVRIYTHNNEAWFCSY